MKIICVGRNFHDHIQELNNETPEDPVLFMKPKSALILPDKDLYYPEFTQDLHYEVELVFRIAKNGRYLRPKFASKYYQEVTVGIDFTARDIQSRQKEKGLPWEIAKSFDGSAAVGKLVSLDDLGRDVQDLPFSLYINGKKVQEGHSSQMRHSVTDLLCHASQYFTLHIGDLLFTGTPAGVGPVKIGDRLEAYLLDQKLLDLQIR